MNAQQGLLPRRDTVAVKIGSITIGGGAPVVVQSMTNTDTADVTATVNQVMSLGQVERWRWTAADEAAVPPGGWVLDVATGEGGLARALVRRWPGVRVVGLDFTPQMLQLARERSVGRPIYWTEGDALHLPFPDGFFDAAVNAFMLRNVTDVRATLAEQARVVRPGGRVVCLEMTWPRNPLFRPLFHLYFGGIAPVVGGLLTGHWDAYRYLPRSVQVFMPPEGLAAIIEDITAKTQMQELPWEPGANG